MNFSIERGTFFFLQVIQAHPQQITWSCWFYLSSRCSFRPLFFLPSTIQVSYFLYVFNFTYDYLQILDYTYDQAMTTATTPIAMSPPPTRMDTRTGGLETQMRLESLVLFYLLRLDYHHEDHSPPPLDDDEQYKYRLKRWTTLLGHKFSFLCFLLFFIIY